MDPFDSFTRSTESNRGNYDPFAAFNKAAGIVPINNFHELKTSEPLSPKADKHWPLIRVKIPGAKDIMVRALPLDQSTALPFEIILHGTQLKLAPGIVGGFLPTNINQEIAINLSATVYVSLSVVASAGVIQSVTVTAQGSAFAGQTPTPDYPPNAFSIPAGVIFPNSTGHAAGIYNLLAKNWVSPVAKLTTSAAGTNFYVWIW
jgi:hypothetical protein